ncbi:MAG: hypothetical protein ACOYD0_13080 [Candidatus Nanopelagicales bacterium]
MDYITTAPELPMAPIECNDKQQYFCPHAPEIATLSTKMDSVVEMLKEMKEQNKEQRDHNNQTDSAITRLNLIVFSIGGSLAVIAVSVVTKFFGG